MCVVICVFDWAFEQFFRFIETTAQVTCVNCIPCRSRCLGRSVNALKILSPAIIELVAAKDLPKKFSEVPRKIKALSWMC